MAEVKTREKEVMLLVVYESMCDESISGCLIRETTLISIV